MARYAVVHERIGNGPLHPIGEKSHRQLYFISFGDFGQQLKLPR